MRKTTSTSTLRLTLVLALAAALAAGACADLKTSGGDAEGDNNAAAGTCSCNTPGVAFEIVAGCAQGFDDATECSGFHSAFCFRDGGPGNACPELGAFSEMSFDNGTSFAAFECEIAIACP